MRNRFRGLIAGSVAVAASVAMTSTSFAAIGSDKHWEDDSLFRPAFSASADILGDERPELIVTDYGDYQVEGSTPILAPGAMYIYSNTAEDGTVADFENWEKITVFDQSEGITFPSQPHMADIDGDGDIDIANGGGFFWDSFDGEERGTLTWWENQNDGQDWVRHTLVNDSPWAYHNLQIVDLDDDGIDDIVTVGEQGLDKQQYVDDLTQLQFYKGLGEGDFAPVVELAQRGGSSPVVEDVDGDGDLDILSAQYFHVSPLVKNPPPGFPPGDGNFIWFENTSDGTTPLSAADFTQHEIARGQGPSYGIYPVGDLFGDGVKRYIGVNHTNTTPGTPGPPIAFLADPNAFILTPGADPTQPWDVEELADTYAVGAEWTAEARPGQAAPGKVVSGDFDGDGDIDLVISGDGDFRAMLIEQRLPGQFHQSVLPGSDNYGQAGLTKADFNLDGTPEIALSSFENQTVGLWSLTTEPDAGITAIANGSDSVPVTYGNNVRAGDTITISSGDNDLWEPNATWRATLCEDPDGITSCPPDFVEPMLWAGTTGAYSPTMGATTDANGAIQPTQLTLGGLTDQSGPLYVKVYQGSTTAIIPINVIDAERTVSTTATTVTQGASVPFTGSAFYPGEPVDVTTSATGAASTTVVADSAGAIAGTVVADKPGSVKIVASGAGGQAESAAFTVNAPPVVTPPPAAKDVTAPTVTLTKPGKKAAVKAKAWKQIKGTVKDTGTAASGPKDVKAKLVVKTAKGQWKFFNGKKWKNAKNKKQAFAKAKTLRDGTVSSGKWSIKAKPPVKGRVIVRYWATDKAGNVSTPKTTAQKITKK